MPKWKQRPTPSTSIVLGKSLNVLSLLFGSCTEFHFWLNVLKVCKPRICFCFLFHLILFSLKAKVTLRKALGFPGIVNTWCSCQLSNKRCSNSFSLCPRSLLLWIRRFVLASSLPLPISCLLWSEPAFPLFSASPCVGSETVGLIYRWKWNGLFLPFVSQGFSL